MSSLSNTQINSRSMNGLINVNANNGTFDSIEVNNLTVDIQANAPTPAFGDNSTKVATTAFVQSHTSSGFVTLNTTQNISGEKTFTNANTYFSGVIADTSYNLNNIELDANPTIHQLEINGKNILLNSQQSVQLEAGTGYTFLNGIGNTYIKNSTGANKQVQIIDTNNTPLALEVATGSNTIRAYANLNITTANSSNININPNGTLTLNPTSTLTLSGPTNNIATSTNAPINIGSTSSTSQITSIRGNTLKLNSDYSAIANTIEIGNNNSSIYINGPSTFDNSITANFSIINNDVASFQNGAFFDNVCPYSNVPPTGSNDLTRKSYVDNNFVSLSGSQTITGAKLFNTVCPQSSVAPTNSNDLTNYAWVNNNIAANMNPTGTIIMYPSSTAPSGYLLCDGSSYNTTLYSALWSVIFYTYGGSGSTFKVPNFQGCFLRGAGSQTIGGVTYTAGSVGTAQQDQVLSANYSTNEGYRDCAGGTRSCVARTRITGDPIDTTGILAQFARQGTENRPVNHAIYYYIKY